MHRALSALVIAIIAPTLNGLRTAHLLNVPTVRSSLCSVRMVVNSTRGPVDPAEAAKAARALQDERVRLAREEQERVQRAWRAKQEREEQQRAQQMARRNQVEGYGLSPADQAKAKLESMFALDTEEASAAAAFELAADSLANAESKAAGASRDGQLAAAELAAAQSMNDDKAADKALKRQADAAAAVAAASAATAEASGQMVSALSQQAEAAVATAARARSLALAAAAAAAAAEQAAEAAVSDTAGFRASAWEEMREQLWSAAIDVMRAEGQQAARRSSAESVPAREADGGRDAGDQIDGLEALEELWNARIRRSLDATAAEMRQAVVDALLRDREAYAQRRAAAVARREALRQAGLAEDATAEQLADAQQAQREEEEERRRAIAAAEGATDVALAEWEARAARRAAQAQLDAAAEVAKAAQASAPLAAGWREAAAPDGRAYYYNAARETTWQRPICPEWLETQAEAARARGGASGGASDANLQAAVEQEAAARERHEALARRLEEARAAAAQRRAEEAEAEARLQGARAQWREETELLAKAPTAEDAEVERRLAAAEGSLLEADSALRRAAERADGAERELEESDEAARTFLAEQSAGRDQAAAVALQEALRTQMDAGKAEALAQQTRVAASDALQRARDAASELESAQLLEMWRGAQAAMDEEASALALEAGATLKRLEETWEGMQRDSA